MNKRSLHFLMVLALAGTSVYAAQERVIRFTNHVRVGYDDNIYGTEDREDSAYITDIINLSAKLNFSSRTDALLYWQPEFTYRFDGDPEFITYQDLYGRLNHALSQRAFLTLSDRFRYQLREGQVGLAGGGTDDTDANYFENDLMGGLEYTLNTVSHLKFGAGYEFRIWEDSDYGEWDKATMTGGNDYDQIKLDASYIRQLKPNKTQGLIGLDYVDHEYEGSRGGYDSIAAMIGIDQNFNPNVTGYGRFGYQYTEVDPAVGSSEDSSTPYLQAGIEVSPTARTTFNGNIGYSSYRSENQAYNAQDRLSFGIGARHDLTAKISLSTAISHIHSDYDADYSRDSNTPNDDAEDDYFTFSVRGTYQVNRNNFVEVGYLYAKRDSDFTDWHRNRVDVGWRLKL